MSIESILLKAADIFQSKTFEINMSDLLGDNDLYIGTDGKHSHYYKDVSKLNSIDIYRVLELFEVSSPCLQHAIKKLLVAGGRGAGKNIDQDIQEAIDSLDRWQEMRNEE